MMIGYKTQLLIMNYYGKAFKFKDQNVISNRSNFNKIMKLLDEKRIIFSISRKINSDERYYLYYELTPKGIRLAKYLKEFNLNNSKAL